MSRIVIVGGGCAAALVLVHLAELATAVDVTVVEPRATIGRGTAYSTTDPAHLMNVRAGALGAHVGAVDEFARWLIEHGYGPATQPFQPRMRYGDYLQERAEAAVDRLRALGGSVQHVRDRAGAIRSGRRLEVQLVDRGDLVVADHVVVALGPPPSTLPSGIARSFPRARAFDDPWAPGAVAAPRGAVLVGSGLTAVDLALSTCAVNPDAVVVATSRSGLVPRAHLVEPGAPADEVDVRAFDDAAPTSDAMAAAFAESVRRARRSGQGWRDVVDALRGRSQALWSALATSERRAWLERHGRAWDVRRHRMAPSVGARIRQLEQDGRLRWVTDISDVGADLSGDGASIVNCTGFGSSVLDHPDPFVRSLLRRRIAEPEPLRLGLRPTTAAVHVIGALRRGDLFETTAIPELRAQAAAVATAIVDGG